MLRDTLSPQLHNSENIMNTVVTSAVGLGITLHQWFRHNEPSSVAAILTLAGSNVALYAVLRYLDALPSGYSTVGLLPVIVGTSLVSLFSSMALYRLSSWHPLAQYPGPVIFRLTKLRTIYGSWRGDYFKDVKKLHDKYGPVVRVAPNSVSIADAAAIPAVLGANGLPKDRYYRARAHALIVQKGTEHAHRRKLWNRGLGKEAMTSHAESATLGVERLRRQFDKATETGAVADMTMWMRFYGFDFMGKFAFGKEFGLVEAGADKGNVWSTIANSAIATDMISHMHWLGYYALFIPGLYQRLNRLRALAKTCVRDRLQRPATTVDLWYFLGNEDGEGSERLNTTVLANEGMLAIVAGSDTTATAMACAIYHLISNPESLKKARKEVDGVVATGLLPWVNIECHSALPYLAACMNETLRVTPIVPTNGSRGVPAGQGGKVIAGHFIPEDTEVFVSPYLMHHNPQYFSPDTELFRPERWIEPGWITNHDAFIPFSAGPAQCVGKNLARMEFTMVISALLHFYDMEFTPGWDAKSWMEHIEEHLVLEVPALPVVLKRRAV